MVRVTYNRDQFWGVQRMAILRSSALAIGKSVVGCRSGTNPSWFEGTVGAAVVSVRFARSRCQRARVRLRCGSRVRFRYEYRNIDSGCLQCDIPSGYLSQGRVPGDSLEGWWQKT